MRDTAYIVGEILGYYLIPGISFISFVVNATFSRIIITNRPFIKKRKYRLLMSKAIAVSIVGKFHRFLFKTVIDIK